MARSAPAIAPLHPPIVPPENMEPAGVSERHQPLFKETRQRAVIVPKNDNDGQRSWRVNRITGEQIIPLNKVERIEDQVHTVVLESDGKGNIRRQPYRPLTDAEKRRARLRERVRDEGQDIIAAFLESGLTGDQIVERLRNDATVPTPDPMEATPEVVDPATDEPPEDTDTDIDFRAMKMSDPGLTAEELMKYPVHKGFARWELSSGELTEKGVKKEDAEVMEAERQANMYAWRDQQEVADQTAALPEV